MDERIIRAGTSMIQSAMGLYNCLKCVVKFKMEGKYYCPVVRKFLIENYQRIPIRHISCDKIILDKRKSGI
jgi:hypothetical protein